MRPVAIEPTGILENTLSVAETGWVCSTRWPIRLRPSAGSVSFAHAISETLSTGPVACEAALMLSSCSASGAAAAPSVVYTRAVGSARIAGRPKGLTPLKVLLARPSQKLRTLKTALMLLGVLRGWTLRVLTGWPSTMIANGAPGVDRHVRLWPAALFATGGTSSAWEAPCEDATSLVS